MGGLDELILKLRWNPKLPGKILAVISALMMGFNARPPNIILCLIYLTSLVAMAYQDKSRWSVQCQAVSFLGIFMIYFLTLQPTPLAALIGQPFAQLMVVHFIFLLISLWMSWHHAKRKADEQRQRLDADRAAGKRITEVWLGPSNPVDADEHGDVYMTY